MDLFVVKARYSDLKKLWFHDAVLKTDLILTKGG